MKKLATLFSALALTVMLVSCGGSNFDPSLVKEGMTEAEVKAACGEPNIFMTVGDKTFLTYGEYMVTIEGDKVLSVEKADEEGSDSEG